MSDAYRQEALKWWNEFENWGEVEVWFRVGTHMLLPGQLDLARAWLEYTDMKEMRADRKAALDEARRANEIAEKAARRAATALLCSWVAIAVSVVTALLQAFGPMVIPRLHP